MTSAIDPTKPTSGEALTADVRGNFQTAANEITALQASAATNTANITTLQGQVTALQGQVTQLQTDLTALTARVTALEAKP